MSTEMPWKELVDYSETHDLLAKRLYVVFSEPTDGLGPVMDTLDPHVAHQTRLEMDGTMFAAGPLATDDEQSWRGEGMFVYRAGSMEEARGYAESDPMHQAGAAKLEAARRTHLAGVREFFLERLGDEDQRALGDAWEKVLLPSEHLRLPA